MNIKVIAFAAIAATVLSGCTSMSSSLPQGSVAAGITTEATYDIIGPAKGTATGATLLGFIPLGGGGKTFGTISTGLLQGPVDPVVANATYNAIESVPTADAIIAPRWKTTISNYIIYQERTVTLQGKAIRYNVNAE